MMIEAKFSSIFAKAKKKKIEGTFFPACAPQIPRRRRRILSVSNSERQESIRERETF
jgi:hypothetical protein